MKISCVKAVFYSAVGTTEKVVTGVAEKIAAALGRTEHAVGSQIHNLRKRGVSIPARPDVHRKPSYGGGND